MGSVQMRVSGPSLLETKMHKNISLLRPFTAVADLALKKIEIAWGRLDAQ